MPQDKEQKSFTILPKSPDILPKSFKILPKLENEIFPGSNKNLDEQYIKEAHQSFVVLGKTNISEDDTIEDILDDTSTASSRDTIRLSEDDSKDEETIIRKPRRLLPLYTTLGGKFKGNAGWFSRNNWVHTNSPQRKVSTKIVWYKIY